MCNESTPGLPGPHLATVAGGSGILLTEIPYSDRSRRKDERPELRAQAETLVRATEQSLQALAPQQCQRDQGTQTEYQNAPPLAVSQATSTLDTASRPTTDYATTSPHTSDMRLEKWENTPEDTAAWLYRLVFEDDQMARSSQRTPVGSLVTLVPDLLAPVNRAAKAPVVDRLLLQWTNLSEAEVRGTSESTNRGGEDAYATELSQRVRFLSGRNSLPELTSRPLQHDSVGAQPERLTPKAPRPRSPERDRRDLPEPDGVLRAAAFMEHARRRDPSEQDRREHSPETEEALRAAAAYMKHAKRRDPSEQVRREHSPETEGALRAAAAYMQRARARERARGRDPSGSGVAFGDPEADMQDTTRTTTH